MAHGDFDAKFPERCNTDRRGLATRRYDVVRFGNWLWVLAGLFLLPYACDISDSNDDDSPGGNGGADGNAGSAGSSGEQSGERPTGRGTATCNAWQNAVCDFVVTQCDVMTESQCIDNYFGVTCRDDQQARDCVADIKDADCMTGAAGCDIVDIADPEPAILACNDLLNAICARAEECGGSTIEACLAEAATGLECSAALGFTLEYETCMQDIEQMACSADGLPDSCQGAIQLNL